MNRFVELVNQYDGFEYTQAYRDEEDRFIGGKGNCFWYSIAKDGKIKEEYIGILENGEWKDVYVKGRGKRRKIKEMPGGTTIELIEREAYIYQGEEWVQGRKPRRIEDNHPHFHYVYGIGDKGLDVSEQYGVTIAYSDVSKVELGFHLRFLYTGEDVDIPELKGIIEQE